MFEYWEWCKSSSGACYSANISVIQLLTGKACGWSVHIDVWIVIGIIFCATKTLHTSKSFPTGTVREASARRFFTIRTQFWIQWFSHGDNWQLCVSRTGNPVRRVLLVFPLSFCYVSSTSMERTHGAVDVGSDPLTVDDQAVRTNRTTYVSNALKSGPAQTIHTRWHRHITVRTRGIFCKSSIFVHPIIAQTKLMGN